MDENRDDEGALVPQVSADVEADGPLAWELIDTGRYMPRRIRGSYRGRELG